MSDKSVMEINKKQMKLVFEVANTSLLVSLIDEYLDEYKKNNTDFKITYNYYFKNNVRSTNYVIIIESNTKSDEEIAQVIDEIKNSIDNIKDLKGLIFCLDNDASLFYSSIFYKKLMKIETTLRKLFYKVHMQFDKENWSQSAKEKIAKIKTKRQTNGNLEEFLFEDLITLLFGHYINVKNYNMKDLSKKTNEELLRFIEQNNPKTFWQTFFPKVKLPFERMEQLIIIRNSTMHFKTISTKLYNDHIKNCNYVINKLEEAEKQIQGEKFVITPQMAESLTKLMEQVNNFTKSIVPTLEIIAKSMEPIFESIQGINKIAKNINIPNLEQLVKNEDE